MSYFPSYEETTNRVVGIHQRPSKYQTIILGLQHLLAMFGGTILSPLLCGFDPNTALFFSGVGTLIFFLVTGGRVPSYLGSSFAFVGLVGAATGFKGPIGELNPRIGEAMGGILVSGILYGIVGLIVMIAGYKWIEFLLPPVVTGSIIMAIGLNLAVVAVKDASYNSEAPYQATITAIVVAGISVFAPGLLGRLPILAGLSVGFIFSIVLGLLLNDPSKQINFDRFTNSPWLGAPHFATPTFNLRAISTIAPVVIIQVAENLGHVKAIGVIADVELMPYLGRAFLGDAIATIVSSCGGGPGLTTYAENIGVMAVTNVYSTLIFVVASIFAVFLGFVPKFGALINCIPPGVLGGLTIILFGLVAATGARIWIQNRIDFGDPVNLITASVAMVLGAGMKHDQFIRFGEYLQFDGLGTSTIVCILVHLFLRTLPDRIRGKKKDDVLPVEESKMSSAH
jgi:uracil-xanthine permease